MRSIIKIYFFFNMFIFLKNISSQQEDELKFSKKEVNSPRKFMEILRFSSILIILPKSFRFQE